MSTVIALVKKPVSMLPEYRSKAWWLLLIMAILVIMPLCTVVVYASGFGGYLSEFLIDRSGVADSNLLIGRDGVSNPALDVGMSGIVIATGATNIYRDGTGTHATLNGNLTDLKGFPNVEVYFEWGYDGTYGNSTTPQAMAATGSFTADITHFNPSNTVNYRGVVEADGTNYSAPTTFVLTGSEGFNLIAIVVPLVYIALVLFVVIKLGRKSTLVALLLMAVAIYLGEAFIAMIVEAINNAF